MSIKVEYNRKKCIGAGTCAVVNPEHWVMEATGKAQLIGGKLNPATQLFEKIVDESQLEGLKKAADGCPKKVIHIKNAETDEQIS
ncbi:MAG: ferredoxin [Candidatus Aenigmarchaeota archaeon]|nr:ferredoxin [Candidatus Aenigmarchaeota archaeon]